MAPTTTEQPVTERIEDGGPGPSPFRRVAHAPFVIHVLALAVVLLGVTMWVRADVSFSMDEPAAIGQAQRLSDNAGWQTPNPLPSIDPSGEWFYVVRSDVGPDGVVLYGKHPLYPMVLAVADRVAGQQAMVVVSVLGTLLAAIAAASIVRLVQPKLDRLVLWWTGLGSPLLFDSQLVIAHAVGAAALGWAFYCLVVQHRRQRWWMPFSVVVLGALACAMRTEAFVGVAVLAGYALVLGLVRRSPRWIANGIGLLLAGGAVALVERLVLGHLVGTVTTVYDVGVDSGGFIGGRLPALRSMLVSAGDAWPSETQLALTAGIIGAVALGIWMRRPKDRILMMAGVALLLVAAVVPLLGAKTDTIPSIFAACPVLLVGLIALRRSVLRDPVALAAAVVSGAFALGVGVSQYNQAGGVEWGARYLALVVPMVVPLVALSLAEGTRRLPVRDRRVAIGACVAVTACLSILSVATIREFHDNTRSFVDAFKSVTASVPGPDLGDGDRRPIAVTSWFVVGRITAGTGPDVRGLSVISSQPADQLRVVADRLADQGVEEFVFVGDQPGDEHALEGRYRMVPADPFWGQRMFIAHKI